MYLTLSRPELAESHGQFFTVIDRITDPKSQEEAVKSGVFQFVHAGEHVSVIPLINALRKRRFNGRNLDGCCNSTRHLRGNRRGINVL